MATKRILRKLLINESDKKRLHRFYSRLFSRVKQGAERRGILFELTREEFNKLVEKSQGCCTVSGIPFYLDIANNDGNKRPFAPSLDRINSSQSYNFKNCRMVCVIVNLSLNSWGDDVFLEMCKRVCEYQNNKVDFTSDKGLLSASEYLEQNPSFNVTNRRLQNISKIICAEKEITVEKRFEPRQLKLDGTWSGSFINIFPRSVLKEGVQRLIKHSLDCRLKPFNCAKLEPS